MTRMQARARLRQEGAIDRTPSPAIKIRVLVGVKGREKEFDQ